MFRYFVVIVFNLYFVRMVYSQPNKNMITKFTLINIKMYPGLTHLTWDTFLTCKAFYITDTLDASKTTLNIIISNHGILNSELNNPYLINICKPKTQVLKIELKNKSANGIKTGNYKYNGSDTKPLNGLPKIELIAKPTLSILASKQSKTYNFETSNEHICQITSINKHYVIGSFYFKDTEAIISGQFKAEIVTLK